MKRTVEELLLASHVTFSTQAFLEFIPIRRDIELGLPLNHDVIKWACHVALLAVDTQDAHLTVVLERHGLVKS